MATSVRMIDLLYSKLKATRAVEMLSKEKNEVN